MGNDCVGNRDVSTMQRRFPRFRVALLARGHHSTTTSWCKDRMGRQQRNDTDVNTARNDDIKDDVAEKHLLCIGQSDDVAVRNGRGDRVVGRFPQGCALSPDGLCVLTSIDNELRLYNTPSLSSDTAATTEAAVASTDNVVSPTSTKTTTTVTPETLKSALTINGGDTVRSFDWYPFMDSSQPSTCCFLATSRDQPIHLYDAYNGKIRATYCPYNEMDEMESPQVVAFQRDGQRVVAGGFRTDRCLHIFDVNRPGRESCVFKLGKTRHSSDGQKGHVSSLAFSSSSSSPIMAAGTYAPGSIYLYDNRVDRETGSIVNGVCLVGHGKGHAKKKRRYDGSSNNIDKNDDNSDNAKDDMLETVFSAAKTKWFHNRTRPGVTQVRFAPNDQHTLYSTSRRSNAVLAWDVRMMTDLDWSKPLRGVLHYETKNDTNQRIGFDVSSCGRYLMVGGIDESVRLYEASTGKVVHVADGMGDVVNGVSCHGSVADGMVLAVAKGTRRFPDDDTDDDSSDDEGNGGVGGGGDENTSGLGQLREGSIEVYKVDARLSNKVAV